MFCLPEIWFPSNWGSRKQFPQNRLVLVGWRSASRPLNPRCVCQGQKRDTGLGDFETRACLPTDSSSSQSMGAIPSPVLVELVRDSDFPQSDVARKSVADLSFIPLRDSKRKQHPSGMVRCRGTRQPEWATASSLPAGWDPNASAS